MNTPTHAILALTVLHRSAPQHHVAIVLGALLPDAPMFVFYILQKILDVPEQTIWREKYFDPAWQNFFDLFNSIPIFASIFLIAWLRKWRAIQLGALAAIIHALTDLPVHTDDAHRHFWPLSNWKFESPISYWDSSAGGDYFQVFEILLVLGCGIYLWPRLQTPWGKALLLFFICFVVLFPLLARLIWG